MSRTLTLTLEVRGPEDGTSRFNSNQHRQKPEVGVVASVVLNSYYHVEGVIDPAVAESLMNTLIDTLDNEAAWAETHYPDVSRVASVGPVVGGHAGLAQALHPGAA